MDYVDQEIVDINGIPVVPLADEIMEAMGWAVGDTLEVEYDPETGMVTLSKTGEAGEEEVFEEDGETEEF